MELEERRRFGYPASNIQHIAFTLGDVITDNVVMITLKITTNVE